MVVRRAPRWRSGKGRGWGGGDGKGVSTASDSSSHSGDDSNENDINNNNDISKQRESIVTLGGGGEETRGRDTSKGRADKQGCNQLYGYYHHREKLSRPEKDRFVGEVFESVGDRKNTGSSARFWNG